MKSLLTLVVNEIHILIPGEKMEDALVGAVVSGVLAFVLLVIIGLIICRVFCSGRRLQPDREYDTSVANGYVLNGNIPTVTESTQVVTVRAPTPVKTTTITPVVPYKQSSAPKVAPVTVVPSKNFSFPTMPVRHISTYAPRYIEERNPAGPTVIVKPQTFNGPYQNGSVVYDIRHHSGYRTDRSPRWNQRDQEEGIATMTLGEESPEIAHKQIVIESKTQTLENGKDFKFVEKENRADDAKTDAKYDYTIISEVAAEVNATGENGRVLQYEVVEPVSTNDVEVIAVRESFRRQRKHQDGELPDDFIPSAVIRNTRGRTVLHESRKATKHEVKRQEVHVVKRDPAVYFTNRDTTVDASNPAIPQYFATDSSLLVKSSFSTEQQPPTEADLKVTHLRVPETEAQVDALSSSGGSSSDEQGSEVSFSSGEVHGLNDLPPPESPREEVFRHPVTMDYRVIKSKRRPSWLRGRPFKFFRKK